MIRKRYLHYIPFILVFLILLIPEEYISTRQSKYIDIFIAILLLIHFTSDLYMELKSKIYPISLIIIIIDIISILLILILIFIQLRSYNETNTNIIWQIKINFQKCANLLILTAPVKYILKNKKAKLNK
jgi:hypothetical protein